MIKKSFVLPFFTAACLVFTLPACSGSSPASPDTFSAKESSKETSSLQILTIGTADSGGTMYPVGIALADAISGYDEQIKVNLSASNGSFTNVEGITGGQFDMGLVSGDVAYAAYYGTDEFEGRPVTGLRAIGAVYSSLSNWMAPKSEDLYYVHDLAGRRVVIGPQGSTTDLAARISLQEAGITSSNTTLQNYGLGYGSQEVLKGNMDAVHGFAGIPIHGLTELAEAVPCRILKYTPGELENILSENSFYYNAVIPAGTYPGQLEDVDTFGIKCLLCVSGDMDEELVYRLTKILDESKPQLAESHEALSSLTQPGFMESALPIPLHPGAERYYIEKGYLEKQ